MHSKQRAPLGRMQRGTALDSSGGCHASACGCTAGCSHRQAVCIAHVAPHLVAVHIWRQVVDGALEADVEAQLLCSRLDLQQQRNALAQEMCVHCCMAVSRVVRLAHGRHTPHCCNSPTECFGNTAFQGCFGHRDLAAGHWDLAAGHGIWPHLLLVFAAAEAVQVEAAARVLRCLHVVLERSVALAPHRLACASAKAVLSKRTATTFDQLPVYDYLEQTRPDDHSGHGPMCQEPADSAMATWAAVAQEGRGVLEFFHCGHAHL